MTLRLPLRSLAFALLLLSTAAAAQVPQTDKESKEEKERARQELERKALALLDETLQGAQALKLTENRAAVLAQGADLIWTRDEKRARSLFREAVADIAAEQAADANRRDRSFWLLTQLRAHVLQTIAARDPQFALELLRDSRAPADNDSGQTPADGGGELRLEQSIAAQAAENDPKLALRMAEESLSKGATFNVLGVLERLRQKDSDAATKLASDIVGRLRTDGINAGGESSYVAASLLRSVLMPNEGANYLGDQPPPRSAEKPKPLVMEDGDVRDLADLVAGAALKESPAAGGYGLLLQVRPLMPELEKRVPARAAQLRQKLAEAEKTLDPHARAWSQFDSIMREPADAILEEAAKAPADMRQTFYSMAAMKFSQAGDMERARQIVNDNMSGDEREQMLAALDGRAVGSAVEKGDLNGAKETVSRIKSKERRASALVTIALAFASKGDRKSALQLLEEARSLVPQRPENQKGIEAVLEVGRGYALVEPAKTFEMIDPLIDEANEMLSAAAMLEKFGAGPGLFRKGEMLLAPSLSDATSVYARYVKALAELARIDFDHTRAEADHFQREEVRLLARLVIARSILYDRFDAPATVFSTYNAVVIAQ